MGNEEIKEQNRLLKSQLDEMRQQNENQKSLNEKQRKDFEELQKKQREDFENEKKMQREDFEKLQKKQRDDFDEEKKERKEEMDRLTQLLLKEQRAKEKMYRSLVNQTMIMLRFVGDKTGDITLIKEINKLIENQEKMLKEDEADDFENGKNPF